jgi:hypothetical protein
LGLSGEGLAIPRIQRQNEAERRAKRRRDWATLIFASLLLGLYFKLITPTLFLSIGFPVSAVEAARWWLDPDWRRLRRECDGA